MSYRGKDNRFFFPKHELAPMIGYRDRVSGTNSTA